MDEPSISYSLFPGVQMKEHHPSPDAPDIPGPTWDVLTRYGEPAAYQSMGSVAAPLLAGFSLTFLGLVLQGENKLRWPSLAMLLLVITTVLFVFVVQCTFWARLYWFTPSEAKEWWPDFDKSQRQERIREEQWNSLVLYRHWSLLARRLYGGAVVFLYSSLAVVLVPNQAFGDMAILRFIAILVAATAAIIELAGFLAPWILTTTDRVAWVRHLSPVLAVARRLSPPLPRDKPPPDRNRIQH